MAAATHSPDPPSAHSHATREALLEAAADVFAEVGFRDATIREICQRARANVAAVNYHFRDKAALYSEVLTTQGELAQRRFPAQAGVSATASAEDRLRAFIRSFLQRVLAEDLANRHGRIMAREMVDPTAALDRLVRELIQPQANLLRQIVQALLPPRTDPNVVHLCGLSVVGQILFYAHCRPVLNRLEPRDWNDLVELDRLTEHIAQFSLAALKDFSRRPQFASAAATSRRRSPRRRAATKR